MDLTLDQIDEALSYISPDCDRGEWFKVGAALKNELGPNGFELFDRWSAGSSKYDKRGIKHTWRSIKATGRSGTVTIATMLDMAKAAGWAFKPDDRSEADRQRYQAEMAERRRKAAEANAAEEAFLVRMSEAVTAGCVQLCQWLHSHQGESSPYLSRKQVGNYGGFIVGAPVALVIDDDEERSWIVTAEGIKGLFDQFNAMDENRRARRSIRKLSPGDFVLPLYDAAGVLKTVQMIYASGSKKFPRYADKSGNCLIMRGNSDIWLLSEGYATGASLFESTGYTTVVCIDSGNLVNVARHIGATAPDQRVLICGDDDPKEAGSNPGKNSAERAAGAVGGLYVLPLMPDPVQEAVSA